MLQNSYKLPTLSVIGAGYVGLVSAACFAESGFTVICQDTNKKIIAKLKAQRLPFYEPGLKELVARNIKSRRLLLTSNLKNVIACSNILFIAIGTPARKNGSCDLRNYFTIITQIAQLINEYTLIINKSTVSVGTALKASKIINTILHNRKAFCGFDIASNPEFLREGNAVKDFFNPDRVVIGTNNKAVYERVENIYKKVIQTDCPILAMDNNSAELAKYAANTFLAAKISMINQLSLICDKVDADIHCLKRVVGSDGRIGSAFLEAGCGFGGSCFPKDLSELVALATRKGVKVPMIKAVQEANAIQKKYIIEQVQGHFAHNLKGVQLAVWGLAFKPGTDDVRESPAIHIITSLAKKGAIIKAYDPLATKSFVNVLDSATRSTITVTKNKLQTLHKSDALILLTECREFFQIDMLDICQKMEAPVIFDTRNIYNPKKMKKLGITYFCVGRNVKAC